MIRNHLLDPENSPPPKSGPPQFFNPTSFDQQQQFQQQQFQQQQFQQQQYQQHQQQFQQPQFQQPNSFGGGRSVAGTGGGGNEDWYTSGRESPMYSYGNYREPMDANQQLNVASSSTNPDEEDYENEPPLLEELGIRFDHILSKTQAVINPTKELSEHILDDADLAGPVFFCLLLGSCLLLSGKVHFGYIYGFSVCGCLGMHTLLNLLLSSAVDFWLTCSVLGYCLLPVIGLAALSILIRLKSILGVILAGLSIIWSTYAATRLFHSKFNLSEQYWLVAYPVMLLYCCFVLITVF